MADPFEQQLKQLHPLPVTGLEEMLYQAGWQAGHTAALAEQASSAPTESVNGQATRRSPRLGFLGGAASGLVAASLLFVVAAWGGWIANFKSADSSRPSEQVVTLPESPVRQPELAPSSRAGSAALAAESQGRQTFDFNLLNWLELTADTFAPTISQTRSQVLTTAPTSDTELDRLLSASAGNSASMRSRWNEPHSRAQTSIEFLRYLPGGNSLPGVRF